MTKGILEMWRERELEILQPTIFDYLVLDKKELDNYEIEYINVALTYFIRKEKQHAITHTERIKEARPNGVGTIEEGERPSEQEEIEVEVGQREE